MKRVPYVILYVLKKIIYSCKYFINFEGNLGHIYFHIIVFYFSLHFSLLSIHVFFVAMVFWQWLGFAAGRSETNENVSVFYEEKPPDMRKIACSEDIIANNKKRVCEIYFSGREKKRREEKNETLGNFIAAKSNLRGDKISMEAVKKFTDARRSASEEPSCELTLGSWKKKTCKQTVEFAFILTSRGEYRSWCVIWELHNQIWGTRLAKTWTCFGRHVIAAHCSRGITICLFVEVTTSKRLLSKWITRVR